MEEKKQKNSSLAVILVSASAAAAVVGYFLFKLLQTLKVLRDYLKLNDDGELEGDLF